MWVYDKKNGDAVKALPLDAIFLTRSEVTKQMDADTNRIVLFPPTENTFPLLSP